MVKSPLTSARMRTVSVALLMLASLAGNAALARGASPYLPLELSPAVEQDIERVLLLAGRPTLRRPFSAAAVLDALSEACKLDELLCRRVRAYLNAYTSRYGLTHASIEVTAADESARALPNRRGMRAEDAWSASAQGILHINDHALVQVGGLAYPHEVLPVGSWLSLGYEYAQLDVGFREHWWSPMVDSSMLVSTQSHPRPGLTLSNYTPITKLGIQYELFLARMSRVEDIAYQGRTTSGHPRLAGVHVSIEPLPGWSLSASRIMQYGGGERGRSFGDFLDAFFQPSRYDNISDELSSDEEFGNQAAAFATKFLVPTRRPFSIYFEYAGEDGARREGWRLGNAALSAGIHVPQLLDRLDLRYEVSDWQNAWYVHGVYPDGLSSDGHVIGHWGGDQRVPRDAVGAQSHSLMLGWRAPFGGLLELRYRTLANESYSQAGYEREHDVSVRYSKAWNQFVYGAEANVGRDVFGEDFSRFGAFVYFAPGQRDLASAVLDPIPAATASRTEVFVDAGLSALRLKYDPYDKGVTPTRKVSSTSPHFGFGVRRRASHRSDIGVRLELDEIDGGTLVGVRAIDYRFRIGERFAVSAFAGAVRYDAPTAAYGYYGGVGLQWRELWPGITVNLDVKGTDKVLRDALLPDDPDSAWGDLLYQVYGANLYLSYRFR